MNAQPLAKPDVSEAALSLTRGIALYVHIPFCETKCPYCDFNTYAGINHLLPSYLSALEREIRIWGEALAHPTVNTVFLGGGTPSMLSPAQMTGLLSTIVDSFPIASGAEVTAEVNPDDASIARLAAFRQAGINRISLGVQSLDDAELRMLGRRHGAAEALAALAAIQEAGFDNFSADLMYGLPHQGMETWQRNVEGVIGAGPQHISAYALTLEEGTPFHKQAADGLAPRAGLGPDRGHVPVGRRGVRQGGPEQLRDLQLGAARHGEPPQHHLLAEYPVLGRWPGCSLVHWRLPVRQHEVAGWLHDPRPSVGRRARRHRGTAPRDARPRGRHRPHGRAHGDGGQRDPGAAVGRGCVRARVPRPLRRGPARRLRRGDRGERALGLLRVTGEGADTLLQLTERGRLLANEAFVRFLSA